MAVVNMPDGKGKPEPPKKPRGKVVGKQKESITSRLFKDFIQNDLETVIGTLIEETVIPGIKDMIMDSVDMMLYGGHTRTRTDTSTDYTKKYNSTAKKTEEQKVNPTELKNIEFDMYGSAKDVLTELRIIIGQFGSASVADYYHRSGVSSEYTDENFGWKTLENVGIIRRRGKFVIRMPKPVEL